jgi:BirA family transcriptional regulator, biotin operon repressor / biotin---[acetyl-CoA-carboxylase] ligase
VAGVALDGFPPPLLARRWRLPRVAVHTRLPSTLDAVHAHAAQGGPEGSVVLAEEQTAGRGRDGRTWRSDAGGVWLAMLFRPRRAETVAVSIRAGLVVADAVDELLAAGPGSRGLRAQVKWPNDVLLDGRKLAGVLCEGRWQGDELQWLAVGVGVNVCNPVPAELAGTAVTLAEFLPDIRRIDLLDCLMPGLTRITTHAGELSEPECAAYATRDALRGRQLLAPLPGRGAGLRPDGALLVAGDHGTTAVREGHVELA